MRALPSRAGDHDGEAGITAIEYAILAAVMTTAVLASVVTFGPRLAAIFASVVAWLP
jgi:Flp pilus assembly pilin Flp